jgi:hypothetical protein
VQVGVLTGTPEGPLQRHELHEHEDEHEEDEGMSEDEDGGGDGGGDDAAAAIAGEAPAITVATLARAQTFPSATNTRDSTVYSLLSNLDCLLSAV